MKASIAQNLPVPGVPTSISKSCRVCLLARDFVCGGFLVCCRRVSGTVGLCAVSTLAWLYFTQPTKCSADCKPLHCRAWLALPCCRARPVQVWQLGSVTSSRRSSCRSAACKYTLSRLSSISSGCWYTLSLCRCVSRPAEWMLMLSGFCWVVLCVQKQRSPKLDTLRIFAAGVRVNNAPESIM